MLLFVSGLISGLIAGGLLASIVVVTCLKRHTNAAISGELLELSKLTGELAHEIRNPLSTIKVNLKLAFEQLEAVDTNSHEAVRALRKIGIVQAETDRLQKILDGFLQYIGKPELQLERIDLNELISDIVDFYSPQAYNHNVTLRMSVLDAPLPVHVDTAMLKQVILNMFINAQQSMAQGGELMVRLTQEREWVIIHVNDTGCGMSPDTLEHIFKPYYSSRPRGSGLGLATANKIIKAHHGQISVESQPGKGTSFSVALPVFAGGLG